MRFSVITITYNASAYLEQSLTSVASQNFSDFEHILWDGGSLDRTMEIARCFTHLQIYQDQDEGIADAMNKGASLAKGEFLLFLHADDRLAHPNVLKMVDIILRQHEQVNWLYGRADVIDFQGKHLRTTPFEPFSCKRLRKYNFLTHPSVYVKRALFEQVGGFHNNLKYCMDYDLWLRLVQYSIPLAISCTLSCFREHQKSLSTSEPLHVADEAYRVRNRYVTTLLERYGSYRTWKKRRRQYLGSD